MSLLAQTLALLLLLGAPHALPHVSARVRRAYVAAALAVLAAGVAWLARYAHARTGLDVEWDFLNYWLAGSIAFDGLPLYDPSSYLRESLPYIPSDQFFDEVMFVGTLYPPPAVLMFLPLGAFEYARAYALWSIALALLLAAGAVLVYRALAVGRPRSERLGLAFATGGLFVFFPAVRETFYYAQVNFVLVILLALLWRWRTRVAAGVFAGLGICVKPYFGIVCLWLFLHGRWRALALVPVTIGAAFVASAFLLGADAVFDYLRDNPVARAPQSLFVQPINQGLLAVLRRALDARTWTGPPVLYAPYLAGAAVLAVATVAGVLRSRDTRFAIGAVLALGLIIAPQALTHYSAVLLPVLVLAAAGPGSRAAAVPVVVAICTLHRLPEGAFWVNLAVWALTVTHPLWGRPAACGGGRR